MTELTRNPYWTGTHNGVHYDDINGNTIRYAPEEDGRQLLIDHVKATLSLSQEQAEHLADHPEDYA